MVFVLVVGAIAIVFFVALIAFLIIKLWLKLISSLEKSQERDEKSIKKEGYRFLFTLLEKDYDLDRYDVIVQVSFLAILVCVVLLCAWFSVGYSYLS